MSVSTIKNIIYSSFEKYKDFCEEIIFDFMGGEPLLQFDTIKEVTEWTWAQQWSLPYLFYASTNGTLVHGDIRKWFSCYKDRFVLGLSYDGDPYTQDMNRSNSSQTIDCSFFAKTWPYQNFKMTISPESLSTLFRSVTYLHAQGIEGMFANLAFGVDWNNNHLRIYRDQLKLLTDYYLNHPLIKPISLLSMNLSAIFSTENSSKYCGAGTGMIFYDFDGRSYPCHLLSPVNLDKQKLKEIEAFDYYCGDNFLPEECSKCILKNICPSCCGMNYLYFGTFSQRFPFLCRAIKIQVAYNMLFQYHTLRKKGFYTEDELVIVKAIKKLKNHKSITQWIC